MKPSVIRSFAGTIDGSIAVAERREVFLRNVRLFRMRFMKNL